MIIINPWVDKYADIISFISTESQWWVLLPRMTQVHGNRVVTVESINQYIGEADGMVTKLMNVELQVRVADCGNIYAYDPKSKIIGVCHTGWQGTRGNIIWNMITSMQNLWSNTQDIVVRTWPCITWKNYQFWPEVVDMFDVKYYSQMWESYYLNLPNIHYDQLLHSGVHPDHIIQSDICTFDTEDLPSYRRNGSDSGRITGSIKMIA